MKTELEEPVLCYIEEPWAFFTTKPLQEQWGDDWNDIPYECNSERPYEYEGFKVTKVAYEGDFVTPKEGHYNSPYSVEMINRGAIAWLKSAQWRKDSPLIIIPAGTTLSGFKQLIAEGGGKVYEEVS